MFFNHGPKMAVKKGGRNMPKKEYIKGTLTVFAPSLIKDASHTIIIPGMLSYIDFHIGEHPYRYISVYAPSEAKKDKKSFEFFKALFNKEVLDPDKHIIISGDWNSARTALDHFKYKDWEHHKPGRRKLINDGIIEHDLLFPHQGYTCYVIMIE